ncbi:hypothetical protein LRP67_16315 [Nocardioides sp. cx-169]|uniref:hypothetical protein n=1 Tax=Nocardioides sp. cx-169 TaxID=2899080 RepID=UPI001E3D4128|nr:hypothetical protein [Nocardioides sp. cx-169]MCD4535658.1 hypothetical protein [Nocardioides sp. cx-169]
MTATITITRAGDEDESVLVDATCTEGESLTLAEALGLIELAKATLIGQAQ